MALLGRVIKRALTIGKKIQFTRAEPMQYQQKVLRRLVRAAKDTEFGKQYHFDRILRSKYTIRAYQRNVPLFNYNQMFDNWWSRAREGEEDVFWRGRVKYFALSSGTSEASSKYIPVTKEMLKSITRASMKQVYSMINFNFPPESFEKGILILGSSTDLHYKGTHFEGDMSGISADKSIPFWINRFFKPGKMIQGTRDWEDRLDMIAREARDWDIGIICGIPSWVQIMIERILEVNKIKSLHEIWPNLYAYVHGGISFEPYRQTFDTFFSEPVTYVETYMASEGFFGFRAKPGARGINLILNNGIFYEFVPFNAANFPDGQLNPDAKTLTIAQVKEGVDYALIISTCAGAWRYLIGDTVKFLNVEDAEIIITGRTKHFLSICGEHLSVDNMVKALKLTGEELNVPLLEFTVQGIPYENLFAHQWYIGTPQPDIVDLALLRKVLDKNLRIVNDDYATERDNVLKNILVELIPNELFIKYLKEQGKQGNQVKFPRVMNKDMWKGWTQFVANEQSNISYG